MQGRGILLLNHRDILTFSLKILFNETDYFGTKVYIKSVAQCERIPESRSKIRYLIKINNIYIFFVLPRKVVHY